MPCCFASNTQQSPKVLVIGLQGAGKSLLVQQLQAAGAAWQPKARSGCLPGGRSRRRLRSAAVAPLPDDSRGGGSGAAALKTMPTIGTELQKLPSMGFTTREVGGAMLQLWHHYYAEAAAVVFVIDAACPDPAAAAAAAKAGTAQAAAKQHGAAATMAAATAVQEGELGNSLCQHQADAVVAVELRPACNDDSASSLPAASEVAAADESKAAANLATGPAASDSISTASGAGAEAQASSTTDGQAGEGAAAAAATTNTPQVLASSQRSVPTLARVLQDVTAHPALQGKPVCIVLNKSDLLSAPLQQHKQQPLPQLLAALGMPCARGQQQEQQQHSPAGGADQEQQQHSAMHGVAAQQQQQQCGQHEGVGQQSCRPKQDPSHRQLTVLEASAWTGSGAHALLQWMMQASCNTGA